MDISIVQGFPTGVCLWGNCSGFMSLWKANNKIICNIKINKWGCTIYQNKTETVMYLSNRDYQIKEVHVCCVFPSEEWQFTCIQLLIPCFHVSHNLHLASTVSLMCIWEPCALGLLCSFSYFQTFLWTEVYSISSGFLQNKTLRIWHVKILKVLTFASQEFKT